MALVLQATALALGSNSSLPPVITEFWPSSGSAGTAVTITGSNLLQVTGITFGGLTANVLGESLNGTTLQAQVPTFATTGPIMIATTHGVAVSSESFQVLIRPPIISGFVPASGPVGTPVSFSGSNLLEVISIKFNDLEASFSMPLPGLGPLAYVPTNATTGPITITTRSGSFTTPEVFTVTVRQPPVVVSFSPTSGPVGTRVQLNGTDLSELRSVTFNGTPAVFADPCPIGFPGCPIVSVPPGATTGPITVTTLAGSFTTPDVFEVTIPGPPEIFSFSPTSGPPGTQVALRGTNLIGIQSISFNGSAAYFDNTCWPQLSDACLTATIPLETRSGPITIVTATGRYTTPRAFNVTRLPLPVITSFSPEAALPGTRWIGIRGRNLDYVKSVEFCGIGCDFLPSGSDYLIAVVPSAPSGPITIFTVGGVAVSSKDFTVIGGPERPDILSFSPTNGCSGSCITVRGAKFGRVTRVSFNWIETEFTDYGTELEAVVPPAATTGPIVVTTSAGQAISEQAFSAFNSGELGLVGSRSATSAIHGSTITFSFTVTNLTDATLEKVKFTNTFASGSPASGGLVIWTNDIAVLNAPEATGLEMVATHSSVGTCIASNGVVFCELGSLGAAASVTLEITVRAPTPSTLHCLAQIESTGPEFRRVYASWLTSAWFTGSTELAIRRLATNRFEIAWPTTAQPVILQVANSPWWRSSWSDVTETVTVGDSGCKVMLPLDTSSKVFRLRLASQ
jgi:hypothetical protein